LSGPPVGVLEDWRYDDHTAVLAPGTVVIGFTDGLIERRRADLETNLDALTAALNDLPDEIRTDLEALADTMLSLSAAPDEPTTDDVAVLVVRCATPAVP
jgi:serine phosphatase RsbU (regulator of sigma subunit)